MILAGGLATRMRPRTDDTPKWLLPVAGRPFAFWQLDWLVGGGVDSVVCCIGHLGSSIVDAVGDGSSIGASIRYSDDGADLRGTAGALRIAADRGLLADQFFVVYGDSYLPVALAPIWQAFAQTDDPALMTVYRNEDRFDTSNVAYAEGRVLQYSKSPASGSDDQRFDYIDYGLSVLRRSALGAIAPDRASDLGWLFSSLASTGELAGYEVHERFYEVGSPDGLLALEARLSEKEPVR